MEHSKRMFLIDPETLERLLSRFKNDDVISNVNKFDEKMRKMIKGILVISHIFIRN